ncbi:hypothetical protein ACS86_18740 [Vibrio alginolyticus]|nr:hypothetical protein ACS86_18740 [Vibrio alginolyticus]
MKVKIEFLLLGLISILVIVVTLGIGVALGGGDSPDLSNYINSIIAFFTAVSAMTTLGTLVLLIIFRHDWKTPKEHDSKLETIVSSKKWERSIRTVHSKISIKLSLSSSPRISRKHKDIEYELLNEKESWSNLEHAFDIYEHYSEHDPELSKQFETLSSLRIIILREIDNAPQLPSVSGQPYLKMINYKKLDRLVSQLGKSTKRFIGQLNQGN